MLFCFDLTLLRFQKIRPMLYGTLICFLCTRHLTLEHDKPLFEIVFPVLDPFLSIDKVDKRIYRLHIAHNVKDDTAHQ